MCGFVAVIGPCDAGELRELGKLIEHRGPDEQSQWSDGTVSVLFRRLSVVDPGGSHQPLSNEDGSILVWFNGEIYNHQTLRKRLRRSGHYLAEAGDGEVIAHLYEMYGERFVEHLEGMFAIALYDQRQHRCLFARDGYGIKPLFSRQTPSGWVFASAPAPLLAFAHDPELDQGPLLDDAPARNQHSAVDGATARNRHSALHAAQALTQQHPALNRRALGQYLRFRYLPTDQDQLTQGVSKVPAGSLCIVDTKHLSAETRAYYADRGHLEVGAGPELSWEWASESSSEWNSQPSDTAWQDSLRRVRHALTTSVRRHLMADVPLGVFLSGGVDSALVVGLVREILGPDAPLHTFTAVFADGDSEGERARQISAFHHTIHHELTITKDNFFAAVAEATRHWGGPVSEPAAIPTLLLSRFAKQHVTVVLTGEGADELFVGYPKYQMENWLSKLPRWSQLPARLIPARSRRMGRLRDALQVPDAQERNITWFGAFSEPEAARLLGERVQSPQSGDAPVPVPAPSPHQTGGASLTKLLQFDREKWLSQNLLHKFDAMTMAASLEARVPFLDRQVVQVALDIPVPWHLRHGSKSLLKAAFADLVPSGYFASPKNGFRVPVAQWLGELDLERELGWGALTADGVLSDSEVGRFITAFRQQPDYHDRRLWTLWALEVWYQQTFVSPPSKHLAPVGGVR